TFSATLRTAGTQSITATDNTSGSITGNQTGITVTPMATSRLSVVPSTGSITAGNTLSVTVTAQDPYGSITPSYTGTIHFTSSDALAGLPSDYTFAAGDNGVRSFTNSVTLKTAGSQTVT